MKKKKQYEETEWSVKQNISYYWKYIHKRRYTVFRTRYINTHMRLAEGEGSWEAEWEWGMGIKREQIKPRRKGSYAHNEVHCAMSWDSLMQPYVPEIQKEKKKKKFSPLSWNKGILIKPALEGNSESLIPQNYFPVKLESAKSLQNRSLQHPQREHHTWCTI